MTLVDTNRDLLVLQDETGAVALNPKGGTRQLAIAVGQQASLKGERCSPYVLSFPAFPYQPSGSGVLPSFEAPKNWGDYYLTRMRGYLRAPVTGEYTFWIASDNSSELWLRLGDDPARVKRIASVARYSWVSPREWSRYSSQRSETIFLKGGQEYYIEALQEQTTGNSHLAVAWQGPSMNRSIIEGRYLRPWSEDGDQASMAATNGVLREYWTNFSLGDLADLAGPRPFESILSVDELRVHSRRRHAWPLPRPIVVSQPLQPQHNYCWVQAEGDVTFVGRDAEGGYLELSHGKTQAQVRVLRGDLESLDRFANTRVRVEGVCEGVYDTQGVLVPGLIWATREESIQIEGAKRNLASLTAGPSKLMMSLSNQAMVGFYSARGVVTFNDRVFGQDYMFVQEETAAMAVSLEDRKFGNQFEVGRLVTLGGSFRAGKNIPMLSPLVIREVGWRSMPEPVTQPLQFPVPGSRDGRWTEVEGVVHGVNSNRTLTLMRYGEPLSVWIGKSATEALERYVDARLRARGVLSLTLQDGPLLLVPSTAFVEVERQAPQDPFAMTARGVSDCTTANDEEGMSHRVKVAGTITLVGKPWFFLQDGSGGIRVQPVVEQEMRPGEIVEVVGFASVNGSGRTLTEALVRPTGAVDDLQPQRLDAGEGVAFNRAGALVQITANLIGQRIDGARQVLELQERQRLFEAELPLEERMKLPAFVPGSRLRLSGVCDFAAVPPAANVGAESPSTGALIIRLRSPADVVLLSGPPWWTSKHTTVLVGTLLTVLVVSLLRMSLLRRRLERQLVFSRQILESQESERHRIAANLHDSLGQNLLVIKNQARLAMQPATDNSVLSQRLDQISGCASQAIDEVREITHALRPYQLDRLGLTRTIRATVNRAAENCSILFASHADDIDGVFDKESEIHVYRIVQEALSNILKHSGATEAAVVVKRLGSSVSLSIRDNGRGFDAGTIHTSGTHDVGHGINGINERVRILGGTLLIDSRPDQGTNLNIQIPISVPKISAPIARHETV